MKTTFAFATGVIIGLLVHILLSLHPIIIGPITLTINPLSDWMYRVSFVIASCLLIISDAWIDKHR